MLALQERCCWETSLWSNMPHQPDGPKAHINIIFCFFQRLNSELYLCALENILLCFEKNKKYLARAVIRLPQSGCQATFPLWFLNFGFPARSRRRYFFCIVLRQSQRFLEQRNINQRLLHSHNTKIGRPVPFSWYRSLH